MTLRLYSYWRSTTSYRVRIALALKGVAYENVPVDLAAGAHQDPAFRQMNPGLGVPVLQLSDGTRLSQSIAILEYLDVVYQAPPLLPSDPVRAVEVREAAMIVASDIHPLNNLKVIKALEGHCLSKTEQKAWMQDWMRRGFDAVAPRLKRGTQFAFGDAPSLADLCIIPQLYNAHRWGLSLAPWPRLAEIEAACSALPAFKSAHPDNQLDCPCPA